MLSDPIILAKVGGHLKAVRLKQNIAQQSLAESAGVSLSTIKKIERGEIRSFDAFLRVVRTLGLLDVLQPLVEEVALSPNEYYELTQAAEAKSKRQRASHRAKKPETEGKAW